MARTKGMAELYAGELKSALCVVKGHGYMSRHGVFRITHCVSCGKALERIGKTLCLACWDRWGKKA